MKEKGHNTISEVEGQIARKSKLGRSFDIDAEAVTDVKEQLEPLNMWKRKRKPIMSKKLSNGEALTDSLLKILKSELSASKGDAFQSWSSASSGGCLSSLKRARSDESTQEEQLSDDNDVEHEAALTLTKGLQRVGSPQVSRTPYSRTEHRKPSSVQSREKNDSKLHDASVCEDWSEGRIESKRPENGTYAGDTNSLMDMEGVGTVEVHRKGKKIYGKKMKVEEVRSSLSDDGAEACSGTEGLGATKGKAVTMRFQM